MSGRPAIDVVVPFRGSRVALRELQTRLRSLKLVPGDSLLIVDNTPGTPDAPAGPAKVVRATARHTPGYARNVGASGGEAEWIVFLDADTRAAGDVLDRYFDPPPAPVTGLIAGGVRDEPVARMARPAARYAYIRAAMSQEKTLRAGAWGFPVTANAAVRRAAFEAVSGFREDIRAAEDADFSYRLRAAGWEIERRERAIATHLSRQTVRAFVAQKLVHGAGGAWLERRYPGSVPARRRPGLVWWGVRMAAGGLVAAARSRDRDRALWALFLPAEELAFELGRSLPNERPLTLAVWWGALRGLCARPAPTTPMTSTSRAGPGGPPDR